MTLTPPDPKRCQALKPNGNTFMTLGGRPWHERCTAKLVVISAEKEPNPLDGLCGSMSLCASCLEVMLNQLGAGKHTLTAVEPTDEHPV